MSDMKCPFCQQELKELYVNGISVGFRCKNKNCPETNIMCGTKALWQALIDTKKKLDIAVDGLETISLKEHKTTPSIFLIKYAQNAKAEITALEQKE